MCMFIIFWKYRINISPYLFTTLKKSADERGPLNATSVPYKAVQRNVAECELNIGLCSCLSVYHHSLYHHCVKKITIHGRKQV